MEKPEKNLLHPSSELVKWLRLLAPPLWTRIAVSILIVSVIAGGLALLGYGVWEREADQVSSATGMLTVAMPVLLIVVALVFGQDSDQRLRKLTADVLQHSIPDAIRHNLGLAHGKPSVEVQLRRCCADHLLVLPARDGRPPLRQRFSVELNVLKANVCLWMENTRLPQRLGADSIEVAAFRHVILGAIAEGYKLNEAPAPSHGTPYGAGPISFRNLDPEFLLHPEQRLYFAQNLSFFVRGILEATLTADERGRESP